MGPQRFAQNVNVLGQIGFLDEALRPNAIEQRVFGKHLIRMFDEGEQRFDDLRTERHRMAFDK